MFQVQQGTENIVILPALNLPHGTSTIDAVELHSEYLGFGTGSRFFRRKADFWALTLQAPGGGEGAGGLRTPKGSKPLP